eukprot:123673-Alexandrium_andersonii.AAC.1
MPPAKSQLCVAGPNLGQLRSCRCWPVSRSCLQRPWHSDARFWCARSFFSGCPALGPEAQAASARPSRDSTMHL